MRKICVFFAVIGLSFALTGCGSSKPTPGQQLDKALNDADAKAKEVEEKIKKEAK